ncbi:unnamed protein product [Ectocarpus sp. CCAP 1310/34]|nr:unnamed protein product [Ectocarpus sp. CCAP 1310/34]
MTTRTRAPPRMTAAYVDQMMTQRRAEELYQNELAKYNEENSMLTHAANNERRYGAVANASVCMRTP